MTRDLVQTDGSAGRAGQCAATVAALLIAALLIAVTGCAQAGDPPASLVEASAGPGNVVSFTWAPVSVETIPAAELEDLRRIAESEGVTLAEEAARTGNQVAIGELIQQVLARFPDEVADAELDGANGGRIRFVGQVPAEALRMVQDAAASVTLGADPAARFSDRQLTRATEAAAEVAARELPSGVMVTTAAEDAAAIVVEVSGLGDHSVASLAAAIEADPAFAAAGVPVRIVVYPASR